MPGRILTLVLMVALVAIAPMLAGSASAAPAQQGVDVVVARPRLQIYPLGTARIETVLFNRTRSEQVFALEIVLVRGDGTIVTAYLSDALALAPGAEAPALYMVRHADGAEQALITPRPWPELTP